MNVLLFFAALGVTLASPIMGFALLIIFLLLRQPVSQAKPADEWAPKPKPAVKPGGGHQSLPSNVIVFPKSKRSGWDG